jgi:hypothetical protein
MKEPKDMTLSELVAERTALEEHIAKANHWAAYPLALDVRLNAINDWINQRVVDAEEPRVVDAEEPR